jgi:hypothetical protein
MNTFPYTTLPAPSAGHRRFIIQLARLYPCLQAAAKAPIPAVALYQSSARQWLFYLQSLCRIYRGVIGKKPFKALAEKIKALEDQLGAIDYWDAWVKETATLKNYPTTLHEALIRHKATELANLQTLLDEGAWLKRDFEQLHTICAALDIVEWPAPDKDRRKIAAYLIEELNELDQDYRNGKIDFTELENGVHEFRRDLRWVSIHAQSLDGLIQLRPQHKTERELRSYITKSNLASPYNKLPAPPKDVPPLEIATPHFLALSWAIAAIGEIKDRGLKAEAFAKVEHETGWTGPTFADTKCLPAIPKKVADLAHRLIERDAILLRIRDDLAATAKTTAPINAPQKIEAAAKRPRQSHEPVRGG